MDLLEGTNSLIQAAKARARGYRSNTKMTTVIYVIAGKLPNHVIYPIYRRAHNCPVMRSVSRSVRIPVSVPTAKGSCAFAYGTEIVIDG